MVPAARQDPSLVILGRTSSLRRGGIAEAEKRLKAYQDTGIDGISWPAPARARRSRRCTGLLDCPCAGRSHRRCLTATSAANGVRIALQGHHLLRLYQGGVRHAQIPQRRWRAFGPQRSGGLRGVAEHRHEAERLQALAERLLAVESRLTLTHRQPAGRGFTGEDGLEGGRCKLHLVLDLQVTIISCTSC